MIVMSEIELKEMIASIVDCAPDQIRLETPLVDIPNWDSLATVIFVSELENVCSFTLSPSDIESLKTFNSVVKLVRTKGAEI